jgi:hypothetical protein
VSAATTAMVFVARAAMNIRCVVTCTAQVGELVPEAPPTQ